MAKLENVIEALVQHDDPASVNVLEEVGTNNKSDKVRELTVKALIKKNTPDSLKLVVLRSGKGINDLSQEVTLTTIDELLAISDKTHLMDVLEEGINSINSEIRENAKSIKALIELSI